VIETVALKAPAVLGLNWMPTGTLWPAATVKGRLGDTSEKYCEEIETLLIVTDVEPRFVTVADRVLFVPA